MPLEQVVHEVLSGHTLQLVMHGSHRYRALRYEPGLQVEHEVDVEQTEQFVRVQMG